MVVPYFDGAGEERCFEYMCPGIGHDVVLSIPSGRCDVGGSMGQWTWDNTTASRKRTRTKRYNEESWQARRHTPNTGISPKATLPSA